MVDGDSILFKSVIAIDGGDVVPIDGIDVSAVEPIL